MGRILSEYLENKLKELNEVSLSFLRWLLRFTVEIFAFFKFVCY